MIDSLPRLNSATPSGQIRFRLWRALRKALLKFVDPIVQFPLARSRVRLPLSHDLPLILHETPQYMTNLPRLANHVRIKYPEAVGIDIGANIGDTIITIRAITEMPLLGVEGHEAFFVQLNENVGELRDVELDPSFIATGSPDFSGQLKASHGTASLVRFSSAALVTSSRITDVLTIHRRFARPQLLKLDTDGLDCAIIESELEWLADVKPVIFFEYDPAAFGRYHIPGFEIFGQLRQIGYAFGLVWDNFGDFLLAVSFDDKRLLEDVHQFFSGRDGDRYCDIAAFHSRDLDLLDVVRQGELAFFKEFRATRFR
jgi:FkbM family methyltransferase